MWFPGQEQGPEEWGAAGKQGWGLRQGSWAGHQAGQHPTPTPRGPSNLPGQPLSSPPMSPSAAPG